MKKLIIILFVATLLLLSPPLFSDESVEISISPQQNTVAVIDIFQSNPLDKFLSDAIETKQLLERHVNRVVKKVVPKDIKFSSTLEGNRATLYLVYAF